MTRPIPTSPGSSGQGTPARSSCSISTACRDTLTVLIGDAATGSVRTVFTDTDKAWVEIMDDFVWLDGGKSLLWLSERDGWQHAYAVDRSGGEAKLLTPGDDECQRRRRRREGRLALRHGLAR